MSEYVYHVVKSDAITKGLNFKLAPEHEILDAGHDFVCERAGGVFNAVNHVVILAKSVSGGKIKMPFPLGT